MLLEPVQAKLRVVIEIVFSEESVDELQGCPHTHGRSISLKNSRVLRKHSHARADDCLRQIHRRYRRLRVARTLGHLVESFWKNLFTYAPLPIMLAVFVGLAPQLRLYRSFFLDEINQDYVRTARAKGLAESTVMFRHVLKNAMIPILTGVVVVIPSLFLGSLISESFFGIPGLGSYTIDAIQAQDFAVVRAMVFLGSVLYIVGLLLTDLSYTLVDPRIRFQ